MPLDLSVQFDIVIYSLLAGLLTGVLFDAYRIIRGSNISKIVIWIEDLLFWMLCAVIIFTFLLYVNYAFLGFYVYLFIFLSLILYYSPCLLLKINKQPIVHRYYILSFYNRFAFRRIFISHIQR